MRRPSALALGLLLGLGIGLPVASADRTIGLVTHEADYREAVEETDRAITELTRAETEEAQRAIGARIAARLGETPYVECLLRYRDPALRHVFLPLLRSKLWVVRARSLYALRHVGDRSVLPAVEARLTDRDPRVREVAAIATAHLATEPSKALRQARQKEQSRFARAAMAGAIRVLNAAGKPFRPWRETLDGPEEARRVQWIRMIRGRAGANRVDASTPPCGEAGRFDWPISWYHGSLFLKTPRNSFKARGRHAGEDMAWYRDGAGIFATANGIVRLVQDAGGDWGFLVVIEHRLPSGAYTCSVHGHLGSDVFVEPGDVVAKNQLIGTVGLSCSVENGGYGSHLHFGLADGPFRRPPDLLPGSRLGGGEVLRLGYDPHRRDPQGRPGLRAVLRFRDGSTGVLPLESPHLVEQTGWICGYVADGEGWHHPRPFILRHGGVPVRR